MARTYKTHDLSLAAYLVVRGYELQEITQPHGWGEWQDFIFLADARLDEDTKAYISDNARVNPRDYAATLSKLKRAMYEARRTTAEPNATRQRGKHDDK